MYAALYELVANIETLLGVKAHVRNGLNADEAHFVDLSVDLPNRTIFYSFALSNRAGVDYLSANVTTVQEKDSNILFSIIPSSIITSVHRLELNQLRSEVVMHIRRYDAGCAAEVARCMQNEAARLIGDGTRRNRMREMTAERKAAQRKSVQLELTAAIIDQYPVAEEKAARIAAIAVKYARQGQAKKLIDEICKL